MDVFLIIVIILFVAAIVDLVVGVSNDAVNFLNSAIGSKVAPIRTILIIATLGILVGSFFSSGIMEVARKGIFNPELFTYDKIMYVFVAVMLTDIILLDLFNTLGLPTSTTVSIVFELLGAASIAGLLITIENNDGIQNVANYINGASALKIVSGIFLSILVAFTLGALVQYFSRLLMSYDYEKNLDRFGSLFAGIAIASISYFLVIKGMKGTPLKGSPFYEYVTTNTWMVVGALFLISTIFTFLLWKLAKVNPLRVVVLMGTFALAMAFAGNDLVNFIGVPIAGFQSYQHFLESGLPADQLYMEFLTGKVQVPPALLIGAGLVMALTLWFSSKARKVTETEVNLGRQDEVDERFKPNRAARAIVKTGMGISKVFQAVLPDSLSEKIERSFKRKALEKAVETQDKQAFDLVRASVNLMMASIIISYATSKKMPLSTTYVSFMVAMGASLADRAWGRESAVYRVAGVLSVVGGWLMTALIAFSAAGLFIFLIFKFGLAAIIGICILAAISIVLTTRRFMTKTKKEEALAEAFGDSDNVGELLTNSKKLSVNAIDLINKSYSLSLKALPQGNIDILELSDEKIEQLQSQGHKTKAKAIKYIKKLKTDDLEVGRLYLMGSDLIQDMTHSARNITEESLHYVKNLHRQIDDEFVVKIKKIEPEVTDLLSKISNAIQDLDFSGDDEIIQQRKDVRAYLNSELNHQVNSIQNEGMSTKQAILQTEILLQSRDIIAVALRSYKLYRNFSSSGQEMESGE